MAQAIEIHKHLLAIGDAINKTEEALSKLDKEDRAIFDDPLINLWVVLRARAMRSVYDRYPELQPIPEDFDHINTDLRWEDVMLPPSISEADLDAALRRATELACGTHAGVLLVTGSHYLIAPARAALAGV